MWDHRGLALVATVFATMIVRSGSARAEPFVQGDEIASNANAPVVIATPPEIEVVDEGEDALAFNAELLDMLFTRSTEEFAKQQKQAAAFGLMGGAVFLGLGAWRLLEDQPSDRFSRGLGYAYITVGALNLTTGIYALTRVTHEQQRLERWKEAKADGVTELELARFEGELRASTDIRAGERKFVRWSALAAVLASTFVLVSTPFRNPRGDWSVIMGISSAGILFGTITFGTSFKPLPTETAWNEYQAKKKGRRAGDGYSWRLAPSMTRRSYMLGVSGTF